MSADGSATVTWDREANQKADRYDYQIYKEGSSSPLCTLANFAVCGTKNANNRSVTFYPNVNGGNRYTARVRGVNTDCGTTVTGSWQTVTFTLYGEVDAQFHEDLDGSCSAINPVEPGMAGARASVNLTDAGGYNQTRTVNAGQTSKTMSAPFDPFGLYTLTLNPGNYAAGEPWHCICPDGCNYSGVSAPDNPYRFYVSQYDLSNTAWWQTLGGHVFAQQVWPQVALSSQIPVDTCTAAATCNPYMILTDQADRTDSAGFALTGGGVIDSSNESGEQTSNVTDRATQVYAMGNTLKVKENYQYFADLYHLGLNPADHTSDFGTNINNGADKPTIVRDYYHVPSNFKIKDPWTVGANESFVIFVEGNLIISDEDAYQNLIEVAEGGFLAFIVQGHINIDANVGNEGNLTSLTTNLEGIFIADGHLSVGSVNEAGGGDERFVAAGTYVGWSGVVLDRDFSDGGMRKEENNDKPTEVFIFRPDLVVNAPETMAKPRLIWQEVN